MKPKRLIAIVLACACLTAVLAALITSQVGCGSKSATDTPRQSAAPASTQSDEISWAESTSEPSPQERAMDSGETLAHEADGDRDKSSEVTAIYGDRYVGDSSEGTGQGARSHVGVKQGNAELDALGSWRSLNESDTDLSFWRSASGGMATGPIGDGISTSRVIDGNIQTGDWPTTYVPQELTDIPPRSQQRVPVIRSVTPGARAKLMPSAPARRPLRLEADWATVTADEIWVIAKPEAPRAEGPEYETPGSGAMLAKVEEKEIPLPLKHTDVKGQISGYIATVEVTQQFQNPFSEKIEAVYVFPLPQNAAVNEFIMVIGERKIRGIIRERQEAEQIYAEARRQGHVASLLTQERPNIFTQKVANIEPGKAIDVNIKYFNTLAYVDGWYEFVFPMVVGPRFNPPGSTEGVGAVGRGKLGVSGQKTEVQYLRPEERSGHDIALAVDIDAGVKIEEISCATHAVDKRSDAPEKAHVQISELDSIPNKDFVLRYKVAGETVKSALVTHRDERGGFFTLMLYPPDDLRTVQRAPMEMVFVLDCSGSMSGKPIAKAKDAIKRALRKLGPDDTFQVIRFSQSASQFGSQPVPATPDNVRKAIAYVDGLRGSGGTMMIEGIKAALDFPHEARRFRLVSFLTDGYIGNEAEILEAVHDRLGESRIFSFGVGTSVNRYLLDRMAKLGKGAVAYVGPNDSSTEIVDAFYDRISHPALTDVTIDWGALEVEDAYPSRIPDLFVGRPLVITGRFNGRRNTTIRVAGKVGNYEKELTIPVQPGGNSTTHAGIACVWARKKIEELVARATYNDSPSLPEEIRRVALEYSLMSNYTAFIAVDSTRQTAGDHGVTVAVPVPVPDGVRYETTVQN